jgi:hypothetical protein
MPRIMPIAQWCRLFLHFPYYGTFSQFCLLDALLFFVSVNSKLVVLKFEFFQFGNSILHGPILAPCKFIIHKW